MRILVTGADGLIGRPLVTKLKLLNHRVITNDLHGDVDFKCDFSYVDVDCDLVIHLAAIVGVDTTRLDPDKVLKINYTNTKKFIDKYKDKLFVFSSSSEVYGNSRDLPFSEDAPPTPVSLYGSLKVVIENYLRQNQVNSRIVRFFNVYGPGQREEFVISGFVQKAIEHKPLDIFGSGEQIRCFTYVDDAVEGLIKMLDYKSCYEIFNIGNSKPTTINELAKTILELYPCEIEYLDYDSPQVRGKFLEIQKRVPDVSKAKRLLDWEATTTLRQGLLQVIKYYETSNNRTWRSWGIIA